MIKYMYLHGTPGVDLQQIVKNGAVHSSPKFLLPDLTLGCPRRGEGLELGTSRSRVNPLISVYDDFRFVCNEMKVICLNDEESI